jgi:hypothetical protein
LCYLGLATGIAGCGFVRKSRLTQIEGQYATLAAETSKLKDESLSLRGRNRELMQRAVEDARRVHDLEVTNEQLARSVAGYQKEREAMADSFERIKHSVQLASNGATTVMLDRLENFARAHPGCSYDPARGIWTFPTDQLFQPGGDDWQPSAGLLVDAFARLLENPDGPVEPTRVTAVERPGEVQRASVGSEAEDRGLARRRAMKLAERLSAQRAETAPSVPFDVRESTGGKSAIEVRLARLPVDTGLDFSSGHATQ